MSAQKKHLSETGNRSFVSFSYTVNISSSNSSSYYLSTDIAKQLQCMNDTDKESLVLVFMFKETREKVCVVLIM